MKKFLWLLLLVVPLWAKAFGVQDLSRQLQSPRTIQGHFVQQRFLAELSKPLQTEGRFVLIPGKALLWQMEKPFAQMLRVKPDGIKQKTGTWWQKSGTGSRQQQQQQMQLFLNLLGGNISGLQQHFTITLSGNANGWKLLLVPKTLLMKQIFTDIAIEGGKTVQNIHIREKQGDRTRMVFTAIRENMPLDRDTENALAGR